jgi:peptide/nickel transport system permease protein
LTIIGLVIILFILFIAIFPSNLAPYDPIKVEMYDSLQPPGMTHPFGTDNYGRDILSRIVYGARYDLRIATIVVAAAVCIGTILGATGGYLGGKVDEVIMRITDIFLAFPALVLAMAFAAALGPSLEHVMIAMIIVWWPAYARLVRGQALSIKENQYIEAARSVGASQSRIIFRHVLPNSLSPIIVQATMDLGNVILMAAGLSFIGVGAQPPIPEWGVMIAEGRSYLRGSWWFPTFPGLFILLTVLGFNLFGDGLRDILDPHLRRGGE